MTLYPLAFYLGKGYTKSERPVKIKIESLDTGPVEIPIRAERPPLYLGEGKGIDNPVGPTSIDNYAGISGDKPPPSPADKETFIEKLIRNAGRYFKMN